MARVTGLGHVGIYVQDPAQMVAFYRDVMGMQVTDRVWRQLRHVPVRGLTAEESPTRQAAH
jgi:catechol 2,3-dioxygenase-like lactoylglutathione lyase family enzyme